MTILNRKRAEVPLEYRWCVEDIFSNDEAWNEEYSALEGLAKAFEAHSTKLSSPEGLKACLSDSEELGSRAARLYLYAFLKGDEDTTNPKYTAMRERSDTLMATIGAASSFFEPELLSLPKEQVEAWISDDPSLQVYAHYYDNLYRQKAHVLSKETEELLARASEVMDAPSTIFQMLESADMRFGEVINDEGEAIELTHARYSSLMRSSQREVRRRAFEAYASAFVAHKNTLAATLGAWIRRSAFFARVRGYSSAQEASMYPDNIDTAVYSNLIGTVREHLPLLHRYMSMRKRALGVDTLESYDMLAPLVPTASIRVEWDQAKSWVLAALEPLGAEYVDVVRRAFDERWLDVYENEGKTSGAYCASQYGCHPFVLLNYSDTLDDVFTLAHEIGHMMHSYYTNSTQPYIYSGYTIFVAEVASTLNEALLMDYLLKTLEPSAKATLINEALEGFRGTIFRQVQFAEFEKSIYDMQASGEGLTHEALAQLYSRLQREYHGDELAPNTLSSYEWSRIPHFYMDFYVYQYATGKSAAEALAHGILYGDDRQNRLKAYLSFLSSGHSAYSLDLLRRAGVDMASPTPVRDACATFLRLLDEMEKLI